MLKVNTLLIRYKFIFNYLSVKAGVNKRQKYDNQEQKYTGRRYHRRPATLKSIISFYLYNQIVGQAPEFFMVGYGQYLIFIHFFYYIRIFRMVCKNLHFI